jgi:hypothetical protein
MRLGIDVGGVDLVDGRHNRGGFTHKGPDGGAAIHGRQTSTQRAREEIDGMSWACALRSAVSAWLMQMASAPRKRDWALAPWERAAAGSAQGR